MRIPACRGTARAAALPPAPPMHSRSRASMPPALAASNARLAHRDQLAHNLAEVGILGREDRLHSEVEQRLAIFLGDDAAYHQTHVTRTAPLQQRQRLARDAHVRAGEARHRKQLNRIDVAIETGLSDRDANAGRFRLEGGNFEWRAARGSIEDDRSVAPL